MLVAILIAPSESLELQATPLVLVVSVAPCGVAEGRKTAQFLRAFSVQPCHHGIPGFYRCPNSALPRRDLTPKNIDGSIANEILNVISLYRYIKLARAATAVGYSRFPGRARPRRPVQPDCVRHQEVGANRPGFPARTIPRLFSALARKLMVCRVYSARTTGLGRRTRK